MSSTRPRSLRTEPESCSFLTQTPSRGLWPPRCRASKLLAEEGRSGLQRGPDDFLRLPQSREQAVVTIGGWNKYLGRACLWIPGDSSQATSLSGGRVPS